MSTSNKPEVVVVAGASTGLGRATVREFARRGAHLGLLARGREGLEKARQEVEAAGGRALVLPTDIADAEQVEAAAAVVEDQLGPVGNKIAPGFGDWYLAPARGTRRSSTTGRLRWIARTTVGTPSRRPRSAWGLGRPCPREQLTAVDDQEPGLAPAGRGRRRLRCAGRLPGAEERNGRLTRP